LKGTKIDVLLDPPQVCGSTDLQVGEFQVTIPGGVCPTDRVRDFGGALLRSWRLATGPAHVAPGEVSSFAFCCAASHTGEPAGGDCSDAKVIGKFSECRMI
jgi:hypothetical protein